MQHFVSFDEGNGEPGGAGNLRIVSGARRAAPILVSRDDIGVTEGLRGLHPARFLAPRGLSNNPLRVSG